MTGEPELDHVEAVLPLTFQPDVQTDQRGTTGLRWVGWGLFEIPGEAEELLVEEDNLNSVSGVFAGAGGAGKGAPPVPCGLLRDWSYVRA